MASFPQEERIVLSSFFNNYQYALGVLNRKEWLILMSDNYLNLDRDELISHAQKILDNKKLKGTYIAEQLNMNQRQLYDYRNGNKKIENAQLETLIKFENLYHKIKDNL